MKDKKPIIKRWYVILALVILCTVAVYLTVKSFKQGYEEGRRMREEINK